MIEESIDERNDMRSFRYWTEQAIVVTKEAQEEVANIREMLQERHKGVTVSLWQLGESL